MKLIKNVYAHCDIPCGIYETDTIKHASATCMRMVEILNEIGRVDGKDLEKAAKFVRTVQVKEKYAQKIKDELCLLWTDYFKTEHLAKAPDLHEKIWNTAKQASKVKQSVSVDECLKLNDMIAEVDEIFQASKNHH